MTVVNFDFRIPTQGGTPVAVPAGTRWEFAPSLVLVNSGHVVLPDPFVVEVVAGIAQATFTPSVLGTWYWVGKPHGLPGLTSTRNFHVPDTGTALPFYAVTGAADPKIADVDPDTYAATATPSAAWDLALALKAPLASPALTDNPTAPTPATADNDTSIATTAHVQANAALLVPKSLIDAKGDLLVGTADNTVARLAVGADGTRLIPDSAQTSGWRFTTTHMAEGSGSPVGVVTAPVGSFYTDTAKTNGAALWRKDTGTGNTGWIVVSGDTGSRDMSSLLLNGWTGTLRLQRNGNVVQWSATALGGTAASAITIATIPAGFLPGVLAKPIIGTINAAIVFLPVTALASLVWGGTLPQATSLQFGGTYLTADAWPAVLPGV